MKNKNPLLILLGLLLVAIVAVSTTIWYGNRTPKLGGDFTLVYRDQPWNFKTHAKKLNLLYVGYAKCPDVCPLSLSFSGQAFKMLSASEAENVQLIFISVDVANDTSAAVADYASQFYKSFTGLTGVQADVDKTIMQFGATYMVEKDPKSYLGYSIAHTDRLFFLDQDGIVVGTIPNPRSGELIYQKIKENL